MAFKIVETLFSKSPKRFGVSLQSQAYVAGQLVMEDKTNGEVIPATSSATTLNILGITTKSYTEGGSNATLQYEPIATVAVLVVADCTNVTAANQLHKDHLLTDGLHVNNTSTTNTSLNGVFHMTAIVGAIGGTKCVGWLTRSGQVTA